MRLSVLPDAEQFADSVCEVRCLEEDPPTRRGTSYKASNMRAFRAGL
jgi:hypothetical protein